MTATAGSGLAVGQFTQWVQEISSSFVTGLSTTLDEIKTGTLSEAEKWQKIGQTYHDQFSKFQQSASSWAEKATESGNPRAAEVWNRIANTFEGVANERAALGDAAWLQKAANESAAKLAKVGAGLGLAVDAAKMTDAVIRGDIDAIGLNSAGILGGALAGAIGVTVVPIIFSGLILPAIAIGAIAAGGVFLGEQLWEHFAPDIQNTVSDWFLRAQRWVQRRDPLTFDLDGDGIETVGINPNSPILFDHDGDGLKTATGWVTPDDAFLVLDRNGNGTIDSGRELFGDATPLLAGGNAVDGFAALQDQDTNADGKISSADARFTNLRLWRDLNQNGISEAGELLILEESGIAAIHVAKVENNTLLPNGNVLADLGSYTRTDGTTGGLGTATGQLGDVDLREDTFHSEFTDAIPLTPEAESLPDMHCIDRNLRQININRYSQVSLA